MRELGSVSLLFRFITIQWRLCIMRCEALDSKGHDGWIKGIGKTLEKNYGSFSRSSPSMNTHTQKHTHKTHTLTSCSNVLLSH